MRSPPGLRTPTNGGDLRGDHSSEPLVSLPGPIVSAVAIGLITGVIEAALMVLAKLVFHRYTHRDPQLLWAAPTSLAIVLVVATLPLFWTARPPSATRGRGVVIGVAAFLGALELTLLVSGIHWLAQVVLAMGVGVQAHRISTRWPRIARRVVRAGGLAAASITMLAAAAWYGGLGIRTWRAERSLPPAVVGSPNVLLLILDTMRASEMSLYGSARPTTPRLGSFGQSGVVFDRAYSPSSWTLPSHASIFTGRHAHELEADWSIPLERGVPTLAEVLAARGYATAGFTGNLRYTTLESGLDRGFARYWDFPLVPSVFVTRCRLVGTLLGWIGTQLNTPIPIARYTIPQITQDLLRWLPGPADRPWFAFVNAFEAHDPYLPSAAEAARFRTPGAGPRNPFLINDQPVSIADALAERDAYAAAVWRLDVEVGAMLDSLQARGALDNTVVVVVGDHGEQFGEHGLLNHGNSLYATSLHVPLLVRWPGHIPEGLRIGEAVSARDVAATILDQIGLTPSLPGRTLARHWDGSLPEPDTVLVSVRYSKFQPDWFPVAHGDLAGVIMGAHQLIRDHTGKVEAFDLVSDPLGLRPQDPGDIPNVEALRSAIPRGAIRP